jgi:hypothetical protein
MNAVVKNTLISIALPPAKWTTDACKAASESELYRMLYEAKRELHHNLKMDFSTASLIWRLRLQNVQREIAERSSQQQQQQQ